MSEMLKAEGGCLCGQVRYHIQGEIILSEYCHCSMCRKQAGGAFINWLDVRSEALTWSQGAPKIYHSSEFGRRGFCDRCGSALTFQSARKMDYISLTIATLDNPDAVPPRQHIYAADKLRWVRLDDDLETFE